MLHSAKQTFPHKMCASDQSSRSSSSSELASAESHHDAVERVHRKNCACYYPTFPFPTDRLQHFPGISRQMSHCMLICSTGVAWRTGALEELRTRVCLQLSGAASVTITYIIIIFVPRSCFLVFIPILPCLSLDDVVQAQSTPRCPRLLHLPVLDCVVLQSG